MSMKIAVVIPTYNRQLQTIRAIKSVLSQTHAVNEIIVVDDGSSVDVQEALRVYLPELSTRIKFFTIEHTGHPGRVRNFGIENSSSDWIAFLDSDDSWEPQKIENQVARISNGSVDAVAERVKTPSHKKQNAATWKKESLKSLMKTNSIICSSVMVSREVLLAAEVFPDKNSQIGIEDYLTWLKIAKIGSWELSSSSDVNYDSISELRLSVSDLVNVKYQNYIALIHFAEYSGKKSFFSRALIRAYFRVMRHLI